MAYIEKTEERIFMVRSYAEVLLYTAAFRMTLGPIRISGSAGQNINNSGVCDKFVPTYGTVWRHISLWQHFNAPAQGQTMGPTRRAAARSANL